MPDQIEMNEIIVTYETVDNHIYITAVTDDKEYKSEIDLIKCQKPIAFLTENMCSKLINRSISLKLFSIDFHADNAIFRINKIIPNATDYYIQITLKEVESAESIEYVVEEPDVQNYSKGQDHAWVNERLDQIESTMMKALDNMSSTDKLFNTFVSKNALIDQLVPQFNRLIDKVESFENTLCHFEDRDYEFADNIRKLTSKVNELKNVVESLKPRKLYTMEIFQQYSKWDSLDEFMNLPEFPYFEAVVNYKKHIIDKGNGQLFLGTDGDINYGFDHMRSVIKYPELCAMSSGSSGSMSTHDLETYNKSLKKETPYAVFNRNIESIVINGNTLHSMFFNYVTWYVYGWILLNHASIKNNKIKVLINVDHTASFKIMVSKKRFDYRLNGVGDKVIRYEGITSIMINGIEYKC